MTLRTGQLILTATLLSGILTGCVTFGNGNERQALLDHHLKIIALEKMTEPRSRRVVTRSKSESVSTPPDVILPLGDPQPMVDEVDLAPDGPSKPFAADPVDEVGLFPED